MKQQVSFDDPPQVVDACDAHPEFDMLTFRKRVGAIDYVVEVPVPKKRPRSIADERLAREKAERAASEQEVGAIYVGLTLGW